MGWGGCVAMNGVYVSGCVVIHGSEGGGSGDEESRGVTSFGVVDVE